MKRHTCIGCRCPLSDRVSLDTGICRKCGPSVIGAAADTLDALDGLFVVASLALGELSGNSIVVDTLAKALNVARAAQAKARR